MMLMQLSEAVDMGYISVAEYSRAWNETPGCVKKAAAQGRLASVRVRVPNVGGRPWFYVKSEPIIRLSKKGVPIGSQYQTCVACRQLKLAETCFYPSGRGSRICRECNSEYMKTRGRFSKDVLAVVSRQESVAQIQRNTDIIDGVLDKREAAIESHTRRIELLGLAGNGKDWTDGR